MLRISRLMGVLLWLFSFQVFALISQSMPAQNFWLDVGTALGMFVVAAFVLGLSLTDNSDLSYVSTLFLVVVASAVMTFRFLGQTPYVWYDLMIIMAAPQVMALAIGFSLTTRQSRADLQSSP